MRRYGKFRNIFLLVAVCALLGGCGGMFGSSSHEGPYFYAEFDDIPIPTEVSSIKETTIITTPGGVKTGLQVFKGRVEVGSLNSAMIGYMQREGWEMRSSTRGARSLLIFEKEDRYATIYILDGMFNIEMQVYVSPKLRGQVTPRSASRPRPTAGTQNTARQATTEGPSSSFDSQSLNE